MSDFGPWHSVQEAFVAGYLRAWQDGEFDYAGWETAYEGRRFRDVERQAGQAFVSWVARMGEQGQDQAGKSSEVAETESE